MKIDLNTLVKIDYVEGCEGNSIYINQYRVVGNKPWGGGNILFSKETSIKKILTAIDCLDCLAAGERAKEAMQKIMKTDCITDIPYIIQQYKEGK